MGDHHNNQEPVERLMRQSEEPVAYMRRWFFDGVDVMKLPKAKRPRGWAFHETSALKLFDDDVPLFVHATAIRAALEDKTDD